MFKEQPHKQRSLIIVYDVVKRAKYTALHLPRSIHPSSRTYIPTYLNTYIQTYVYTYLSTYVYAFLQADSQTDTLTFIQKYTVD